MSPLHQTIHAVLPKGPELVERLAARAAQLKLFCLANPKCADFELVKRLFLELQGARQMQRLAFDNKKSSLFGVATDLAVALDLLIEAIRSNIINGNDQEDGVFISTQWPGPSSR